MDLTKMFRDYFKTDNSGYIANTHSNNGLYYGNFIWDSNKWHEGGSWARKSIIFSVDELGNVWEYDYYAKQNSRVLFVLDIQRP